MAIAVTAMVCLGNIAAQTTDKRLLGAWLITSMQYDGEDKIVCGKELGYTSFKYYGADGEYACAEIGLQQNGKFVVCPHEYGTYTFQEGVYSEMGRPAGDKDALVLVDDNTFKGRFLNRNDVWRKQPEMPKELVDYIVNYCKIVCQVPTPEVQQLIREHIFDR